MSVPRASLAFAIAALPAIAGEFPERIEAIGGGGDFIEITRDTPYSARVVYHNTEAKNSRGAVFTLQAGGDGPPIVVEVQITVADGPECITVTPRHPFTAQPDQGCVEDGESLSVDVVLSMF